MITKGILGKKGLTQQAFSPEGERMPVTHIQTSPCYIVNVKTSEKDGYWSMQLGFDTTKNTKKSRDGISKKAGIKAPLRFLREIRFDEAELITNGKRKGLKVQNTEMWVGDEVKAGDIFATNDSVDVTGTSKGKGFQGVVRRHGFAGGPKTHGQSDRHRAPGSIGSGTTPGRVYKGKKMAGRMGGDTITVKNLPIIEAGDTFITVRGLVPGSINGLLLVKSSSPIPEKTEIETPAQDQEPIEVAAPIEEVAETPQEAASVEEATPAEEATPVVDQAEEAPVENVEETKS